MLDKIQHILIALLGGISVTISVTLGALIIAVLLGLLLGVVRSFTKWKLLRFTIDVYVELFRNIPALAILFIIYFGLGSVGLRLGSVTAAILGLGLIGGAVLCDVFRAGFSALHSGQREAAIAIGMTPYQTIRLILAPQAIRIALPPLGNYAIQLLKDTSIASAIAAPEIMFFARTLVTSTFETTLIYICAAGIYLLLSLPLFRAIQSIEKRFGVGR
ncbi:ABC transporter permease subunit [Sneathiella sp. DP05]|uniref:ABC transporter permease subunit n=2 Tax=Sneathiella litorea TaxID=2606216 RepID=A0A6L8W888_9PROT|nr:ABC transporter permease subunit [Sneathiella litorea]